MRREFVQSDDLLKNLGDLSEILSKDDTDNITKFKASLNLINKVLNFDLSILYRVQNVVGNLLILEVVEIMDPSNRRKDLYKGIIIKVNLLRPAPEFVNEATAYKMHSISNINVPGEGADLMGFIDTPDDIGGGFLFGGDYLGDEASISVGEKFAFSVMCNLLSCVEMRGYYKQMATYDSLTAMYNSRHIRTELENAYSRFKRDTNRQTCVILCDIDFFKKVNDTYGHIQGDQVLKEVGAVLKSQMRQGFDVVGRYGGEEFLVIMDGCSGADALRIVDRWRKKIESNDFQRYDENGKIMPGESFHLTMSFGIAVLKVDHEDQMAILADADKALYQAKETGRNKVIVFSKV